MTAFNASRQVTDPFEDTNTGFLRSYENETAYVVFNYARVVTDVIKLILCICVIAADIFLLYIFSKFKKLRSKANRYIMHYAISNILYLTLAPVLYIIIDLIPFVRHNSTTLLCIIIQIENTCLMFCFLLAFGLGIDWLLTSFSPGLGQAAKQVYKYSITFIYILGFIKFLAQSSFCFLEISTIRHIFSLAVYSLTLVFILVLDYLSGKYKISKENGKSPHSLIVANIIVLSWLPMYIYHLLVRITMGNDTLELVLWYTVFMPEWLAYGSTIVILIVLIRTNKAIRRAYYKVFRRSAKKYSNQDSLDDSQAVGQTDAEIPCSVYI